MVAKTKPIESVVFSIYTNGHSHPTTNQWPLSPKARPASVQGRFRESWQIYLEPLLEKVRFAVEKGDRDTVGILIEKMVLLAHVGDTRSSMDD
jgi:hypothetical protein